VRPSGLLKKLFSDTELFGSVVRLCMLFGPGFIAVGFYEREIFINLDWFKLLSVSALFSVVLVFPSVVAGWILRNSVVWVISLRMRRPEKGLQKLKVNNKVLADRLENALDEVKKIDNIPAKLRIDVEELHDKCREHGVIIEELGKRLSDLRKGMASLNQGFYQVILSDWSALTLLFFSVVTFVGVDFVSAKLQTDLRHLVYFLAKIFYVILPSGYVILLLKLNGRYQGKEWQKRGIEVAVFLGCAAWLFLVYELLFISYNYQSV
jgi:hypothetical protein